MAKLVDLRRICIQLYIYGLPVPNQMTVFLRSDCTYLNFKCTIWRQLHTIKACTTVQVYVSLVSPWGGQKKWGYMYPVAAPPPMVWTNTLLHGTTVDLGYILGPILFLLYTADLLRLVEKYNLRPHLYADDTQIYGSCHPTDTAQLQLQMSACIDNVATWMCSNRLQLNTAKTEVIWCSSSRRQHHLPQTALRVGNNSVMPSTWASTSTSTLTHQ